MICIDIYTEYANSSHQFAYTLFLSFPVKGLKRRRASKLTAIEFMEKTFFKKADLKEKVLALELQQKKFEAEEEERKQRLQLEMEERRAIIEMLNRR